MRTRVRSHPWALAWALMAAIIALSAGCAAIAGLDDYLPPQDSTGGGGGQGNHGGGGAHSDLHLWAHGERPWH